MPHTLSLRDGGLLRTFTGTITGSEIIEANLKLHGNYIFDDLNYVINDFSRINDCIFEEDDLLTLKTFDDVASLSKSHLKIAIIVTMDAFIDLAKIYCESMRQSSYDAKIFSSLACASKWTMK